VVEEVRRRRRRRSGRATIGAVAARAGVSTATVSRTLGTPRAVAPATRQRVLEAIEVLDYRPDGAARRLARSEPAASFVEPLALIVPDLSAPGVLPLIRAATHRAAEAGRLLALAQWDAGSGARRATLARVAPLTAGILLLADDLEESGARAAAAGRPLVRIGSPLGSIPTVLTPERALARAAIDELRRQGHRSISALYAARGSPSEERRSLLAQLAREGIRSLGTAAANYEAGHRKARSTMARGETAVVVFDDELGHGLVDGLRARGLSVPGDVSIIQLRTIPARRGRPSPAKIGSQGGPSNARGDEPDPLALPREELAIASPPPERLGTVAVEMLLLAATGRTPPRTVRLEATVEPGRTLGQSPAHAPPPPPRAMRAKAGG
jgi:DNA-binding LacI/PurR family transcriptional regulator